MAASPILNHEDYTIAWICALPETELAVASAMLDVEHPLLGQHQDDTNTYILGKIYEHNIVIACLPAAVTGSVPATVVATHLLRSFPAIRFGLMVGVGGGAPLYDVVDGPEEDGEEDDDEDDEEEGNDEVRDIRLGDVVISLQDKNAQAVVQYDFGKSIEGGEFIRDSTLSNPPIAVLTALSRLKALHVGKGHSLQAHLSKMQEQNANLPRKFFTYPGASKDRLFKSNIAHVEGKKNCKECGGISETNLVKRPARHNSLPKLHYGTIGSANNVMKDSVLRDKWARSDHILCFEMEAAGLMNSFPCLVIRGICDYSDSHKNKLWQPYAAATAAAYAKELLRTISPIQVRQTTIIDPTSFLGALSGINHSVKQQTKTQERLHSSDQQLRCRQMFKTRDYERYKNINPEVVRGTCQWVLRDPNYTEWLANKSNNLLWISADPGCGKSVLSRHLIDEKLLSLEPESTIVCYFFFKDNDNQNTLAAALCAVLHQLFCQNFDLIPYAIEAWEKSGQMLATDVAELWRILNDAACDSSTTELDTPSVVCILDALDECKKEDLTQLLELLSTLCSSPQPRPEQRSLRFLLTSRPYENIIDGLLDCPKIRLSGEEKNDEINKEVDLVIRHKVAELARRKKLNDAHKTKLEKWLLSMEHRTYLWLYLAFDGIEKKYELALRPDSISFESLQLLDTVDKAYENILNNSEDPKMAKTILRIIVGARRPLEISEMAIALGLGIRPGSTSYLQFKIEESSLQKLIRHICGLFIFVNDSTVYLIHQTAKEFIVSTNMFEATQCWKGCLSLNKTEEFMARICIDFLSLAEFDSIEPNLLERFLKERTDPTSMFQKYKPEPGPWTVRMSVMNSSGGVGFWEYVALNWTGHFKECVISPESDLLERAYDLYEVKEARFHFWFSILFKRQTYSTHVAIMNKEVPAAYNGHIEILRLLQNNKDFNVNSEDNEGRTALFWGAKFAYKAVVDFLVQNGADINAESGYFGTALGAASGGGHLTMVKLLLQNGADVNFKHRYFGTALDVASGMGHQAMVEMLIQNGANVNAMGGYYNTALGAASEGGHLAIVELLLHNGADVNAVDTLDDTALRAALRGGNLAIVKLLLQNGADVNTLGGYSAIRQASERGYLAIVELLLRSGNVDIDLKDIAGHTPLSVAAKNGHTDVILLLLSLGAQVDSRDGNGRTPLSRAAKNGQKGVVQLLLETGIVDVDSEDEFKRSPLWWAVCNSHEAVALLLLNYGAQVESKDYRGRTPLSKAIKNSHKSLVQLLLSHGARIDYRDNNGFTTLFRTSPEEETAMEMERLVLRHGVSEVEHYYGLVELFTSA